MAFTFKHGDKPLEGYVIQRGVGRGGFGEVYYALSEGGKEVALKYLRDNPQIELRGVSHCMNLKSPHLVTIYDVRQNAEGDNFIVMEYVHGPSLRDLLVAEPNGLGMQKAAFFVNEIAKGLGYLHDRGIIHRDMKPGNIFYEDGYVKIGDYGLSKFISLSRHSGQTASVGTVHYMAPEVGSGNYHRGIDIYALGVILYEMLLGRVPFEGSSMGEVLMKHLTEQPEVQNLPAPFADVIRKALAKDPGDRYPTVHEMAQDILGVEDVRRSIAAFEPASLTTIARQAMETQVMDSPHPSPHVVRPPKGAEAVAAAAAQRRRDPQEVLDANAFSDRLAGRMEKVAARAGRGPKVPQAFTPAQQEWGAELGVPFKVPSRKARLQGFLASVIIALGLSVAAGVVTRDDDMFGSVIGVTFAFVMALRLGIAVAVWVIGRMTTPNPSAWATGLITLGCSTLPVLLVGQIAHDEAYRAWDRAWGADPRELMLAVLAMSGFVNWARRVRTGLMGRVEFKDALKAGFFGMIAAAACGQGESALMIMGAAIGAATSLALQTGALFARRVPTQPGSTPEPDKGKIEKAKSKNEGPEFRGLILQAGCCDLDAETQAALGAEAVPAPPADRQTPGAVDGSGYPPLRRPRPKLFRAIWITATVVLLIGAWVLALGAGLIAHNDEELMGFLIGLFSCVLWSIFTMLKSTRYRRQGFWNESLRPFLATLFFNGAMSLALVIAFISPNDEELFGLLAGLVPCGLLGLICAFAGRRPRVQVQVQAVPIPRRAVSTLASAIVGLLVAAALGAGVLMLLVNPRRARAPLSRTYVLNSEHGLRAARAYSAAMEEVARLPDTVRPPLPPSTPQAWWPVKGLEGVYYTWEPIRPGKFNVRVRSDCDCGEAHLLLRAVAADGKSAKESFDTELMQGRTSTQTFEIERLANIRDVEVEFVHKH